MSNYIRSTLAEKELAGYRVVKVLRNQVPTEAGNYEHSLVLESDTGITKQVPVGDSLTIHSFTNPNQFKEI